MWTHMRFRIRLFSTAADWAEVMKKPGLNQPWHLWLAWPRCHFNRTEAVVSYGVWILVVELTGAGQGRGR